MDTAPLSPPPLYSPAQIASAAFIGSPAAAGWFIAHNYKAIGEQALAKKWFWGLLASTIVLLIGSSFLPDSFPNMALPIGYTIGIHRAAQIMQGDAVARLLASGGIRGSSWKIVGVSVLVLLAVLATCIGIGFLLPS
jgi:hypothetical protein